MAHNATQVQLGGSLSSDRDIVCFDADPALLPAGTIVRLKSDGTLSKISTDGALFGVSMGVSFSSIKRLAVCKAGNQIPVLLNVSGDVTTYAAPGKAVYVDNASGKASTVAGSSLTSAIYTSGQLTGLVGDGTTTPVALIDMGGGL